MRDKDIKKGIDFQTPPAVADYMVSLIPVEAYSILEPTPGQGNLIKALNGFKVTAPDDFFLLDKSARYDCIIMNPPFSAKYAYLENAEQDFSKSGMKLGYHILTECMKMSDNVIALMPWFTISDSDVRLRFIKQFGLRSITALPRKTFQYARIQTCVFELEREYTGETIFKTFDF